jgi:hypothetical protein
MLKTAWASGAAAAVGGSYTPDLVWQGLESEQRDIEKAYARVQLSHVSGHQSSLTGAEGAVLFERGGVLIVQCLAPFSSGKGLTYAEALAQVVLSAFEKKHSPGGAWFRNCRMNEVGPDNAWFIVNAVVEFIYDEVK